MSYNLCIGCMYSTRLWVVDLEVFMEQSRDAGPVAINAADEIVGC